MEVSICCRIKNFKLLGLIAKEVKASKSVGLCLSSSPQRSNQVQTWGSQCQVDLCAKTLICSQWYWVGRLITIALLTDGGWGGGMGFLQQRCSNEHLKIRGLPKQILTLVILCRIWHLSYSVNTDIFQFLSGSLHKNDRYCFWDDFLRFHSPSVAKHLCNSFTF